MVSNYRCSEVKKEAIDEVQDDIKQVLDKVKEEFHPDLKKNFDTILSKSIKLYKANTDQYDEDIVNHKKTELEEDLRRNFKEVSAIQEQKIEAQEIYNF